MRCRSRSVLAMGVVRVTAMAPGSVEYLLHGCDSHPEQGHEHGSEQGIENGGDGLQRTPGRRST
ncbi:hypothetical protein FRP1_30560 (plasmid) [Pseudonocardia sp. EC080625-04]|nr:hypothetical protein FRP1_30560 [Pseudonocardia sp. EC080625-04]